MEVIADLLMKQLIRTSGNYILIVLPRNVKGTPKNVPHSLPKPCEMFLALQGQVVFENGTFFYLPSNVVENMLHRNRETCLATFNSPTREVAHHLQCTSPHK